MAIHAEAHVQIDVPLRYRLLSDVAVARCALDLRTDMRRVVELDVRLPRVSEDALPRQIQTLFAHLRYALNPRSVGRNRVVAHHARADARQTRNWTSRHGLVAVLSAGDLLSDVYDVWEFDRLDRLRTTVQEVVQRGRKRRPCGREDGVGLAGQEGRPRGLRNVAPEELAADTSRKCQDRNANDSGEEGNAVHGPNSLCQGLAA
jgi:hypothetical protein